MNKKIGTADESRYKQMETVMKRLEAQHGIVCRMPGEKFGYFGWPTVARLEDGMLIVASSGLRVNHVCPWGKTVINLSRDDGRTWSAPRVIQDSPIDDRDAGVISLGGKMLLVTWFTSDTRPYANEPWIPEEERREWHTVTDAWTDEVIAKWLGSWVLLSDDGGKSWGKPLRAPVSTPHGPIRLRDGSLLYLGKDSREMSEGKILAARSKDGGQSWEALSGVPLFPGTTYANYHEPHVAELPDGRLVGMIRLESAGPEADVSKAGLVQFSLMQTESTDGGYTWSDPVPRGFHGSPPHLMVHSDGTLICTYGYRLPGFGQRVMLSRDGGRTWDSDWIVRDDGPDGDLGYPSTVELGDGSLFSVYYQKYAPGEKCSLLWSRWRLP
jgi:sialidase-1